VTYIPSDPEWMGWRELSYKDEIPPGTVQFPCLEKMLNVQPNQVIRVILQNGKVLNVTLEGEDNPLPLRKAYTYIVRHKQVTDGSPLTVYRGFPSPEEKEFHIHQIKEVVSVLRDGDERVPNVTVYGTPVILMESRMSSLEDVLVDVKEGGKNPQTVTIYHEQGTSLVTVHG